MQSFDVTHPDVVTILWPSGPSVNSLVNIISTIIGQAAEPEKVDDTVIQTPVRTTEEGQAFWLTPVSGDEQQSAEDCVQSLVGKEGIYAFGERTPGRNRIKEGDGIAFYSTGVGVIANALVSSRPENKPNPVVRHPDRYPYVFKVKSPALYPSKPILLDSSIRSKLDAFKGRDLNAPWAWFVQSTRAISKHDFELLTSK